MNKKISIDIIIVGFAIFATIFGAGNLIFPSALGFSVGTGWTLAIIGFLFSGIMLPALAIVAVGNNGGSFENISLKVGPVFSKIFYFGVMVLIIGLVGQPRIGAVTYELGVNPIIPDTSRILVAALFYGVTICLAINPANVVDKIGKYLTPILLLVLGLIIGKGIISPIGTPTGICAENPFVVGFYTGYEIGDALGATVVATIFTAAVVAKGYSDSRQLSRVTAFSALVGATLLFLVYGGLVYLGATASSVVEAGTERSALLAAIVSNILGESGMTVMGVAVIFACLTTATGLSAAMAGYFNELSKGKLSYKAAVILVNVVAGIYSIVGVETIMKIAMPVLMILYPVAIVLIILGVFDKYIPNRGAYIGAAYLTLFVNVLNTLAMYGIDVKFISWLPLSKHGFGWCVPAVVGLIIGLLVSKKKADGLAV
ncbi:MAG: branched-chain amino acid transport system II carrier protein [Deltaproteobacteria bacterium]|nr:branched-chain amino acid transport system II carrier protein [Deltaproteobacteria bacterium]